LKKRLELSWPRLGATANYFFFVRVAVNEYEFKEAWRRHDSMQLETDTKPNSFPPLSIEKSKMSFCPSNSNLSIVATISPLFQ